MLTVFSHVVICSILLIYPSDPLKARIRHVFLVMTPADTFVFQKINDRGYVRWDPIKVVVVHAEIFAADRCDIIGLARMRHATAICYGLV